MPNTATPSVFMDPQSPDFKRQLTGGGIALAFWERVTSLGPQWVSRSNAQKLEWIAAQAAGFLSLGDLSSSGFVHIADLRVPMHMQGHGIGTAIMRGLCWQADYNGWSLTLEPERHRIIGTDQGLVRYYKGFGFIQNRGRKANLHTSAGMLRYPVGWVK